ncbi:MAG: two-component regulator propeller domain-containing protein, partial [Flavobacteriaceae bacterium]
MEEYAAGNQNWSLTQGKNDEIYIANNEGILKYDAERWTLYPTNSIVRSVAVFDGVLYSGSYMDFGYWEEQSTGELVYQSLVEQYEIQLVEDEQFWHIYQIEDTLIFQSLNRLFLWNQSTNQFKQIQPDKPIIKSFVVNQQLFFHLENDGIYKYDSEGIRYFFGKTEFKDTEVIELFSLSDGFRILTSSKGFYTYLNQYLRPWNIQTSILKNELVYSGLQSSNGDYVVGTVTNGLYIITEDGRGSKHYNFEKGLLNNTILSIFQDKNNNLWLGLDSGINCILIDSPFQFYNDAKGQLGTVYASKRFQNMLYLATNRGLFYRPYNNPASEFKSISGLSGQNWNLEIVNGVLFVGHDRGTFTVQGNTAIRIGSYIGAWTHKTIDRNTIYVGAYDGIHVLNRQNGVWRYGYKISGFDISSRHMEIINNNEILISHEYKGVYHVTLSEDLSLAQNVKTLNVKSGRHSTLTKFNDNLYYLSPNGLFGYVEENEEFLPLPISSRMFENDFYVSGKMI